MEEFPEIPRTSMFDSYLGKGRAMKPAIEAMWNLHQGKVSWSKRESRMSPVNEKV